MPNHHFMSALTESKGNPEFWLKMVKSLSHNPTLSIPSRIVQGFTSAGKRVCDAFTEHFISSGYIFENAGFPPAVSDHSAPYWANRLGTQTFSLKPFTNHEVFNALCSIDLIKSTGADQLDPRLLLLAVPFVVECLTYIFNLTVINRKLMPFYVCIKGVSPMS